MGNRGSKGKATITGIAGSVTSKAEVIQTGLNTAKTELEKHTDNAAARQATDAIGKIQTTVETVETVAQQVTKTLGGDESVREKVSPTVEKQEEQKASSADVNHEKAVPSELAAPVTLPSTDTLAQAESSTLISATTTKSSSEVPSLQASSNQDEFVTLEPAPSERQESKSGFLTSTQLLDEEKKSLEGSITSDLVVLSTSDAPVLEINGNSANDINSRTDFMASLIDQSSLIADALKQVNESTPLINVETASSQTVEKESTSLTPVTAETSENPAETTVSRVDTKQEDESVTSVQDATVKNSVEEENLINTTRDNRQQDENTAQVETQQPAEEPKIEVRWNKAR